ncbi:hypothetical protein HHK36_022689 [Tetracentron sinense]|uniref:AAA+ ATPase domain-containing protein n=1 Tax=Tetracentron sinense TaxID=13715 RepID=A0A834YVA7_TETSI|nr:hypothetical protein HHK36_022689 [Tetracentron sinense]
MDPASAILNTINRLWDCIAPCADYIHDLEENLNSLRSEMRQLISERNDLRRRVDVAEGQQMRRRDQVEEWFQMVEATEHEVDQIIEEGSQQISNKCLRGCCPKNCRSSYKAGKRVVKKLAAVAKLRSKGDFIDVVDRLPPATMEGMPSRSTVGMDLMLENVWKCLTEDPARIIGLYGMGGVGKTTLLMKINNEFLHRGTHDFDVVIYVVVSKKPNVRRVQMDIGERLGLELLEDERQDAVARSIFNSLNRKKFLLLLDDIWDRVELELVGIPRPDSENKSKIVFTTRFEAVCGHMEAQKKLRIECLGWDDAWDLFKKMVGDEVLNSHPEISKLAPSVAKECAGLPLALITIGRTMASKKTPQEWNHAIKVLRDSAAEFPGMGDEVLPLLKFSYDSLPNDTVQSCFLYCSLYSEDFNISKEVLIKHWIGEGFIVGFNDMKEACNHGYDIIGTLRLACLLESGAYEDRQVKMHDVIRDLALWIACECGRKNDKFLVQARVGLNEAPEVEKWEETERISLMHNNIRVLTETPTCPNLLTLILNNNKGLNLISASFFKFMYSLRVLDLSYTSIRELPMEIVNLVELQYLNLSSTPIETLPDKLEKLVKLKYLDLRHTDDLVRIPFETILTLPRLQVLDLYNSKFGDWEVEDWGGASLGKLEHLKALGITIKSVPALQRLFNSQKISRCTNYLCIKECQGLTSFPLLSSSTSTLVNMKYLNELRFQSCIELEELTTNWVVAREGENEFYSNLEKLYLYHLSNFKMVTTVAHGGFQNVTFVSIKGCHGLKNLTWILCFRNLETLILNRCKGIEEVICGGVATIEESLTFSRLKTILFHDLPKVKSIYSQVLPFHSLEVIDISNCPELKKLPLDSSSAKNTLKKIRGEKQWLDELEWEDESIKSVFLPYLIDF